MESTKCLLTLTVCNHPLVAITSCRSSRSNNNNEGNGSNSNTSSGISNDCKATSSSSSERGGSSSGSMSSGNLYAMVSTQGVSLWEIQRGLGHVYVAGGHTKAVVALHTGSLAALVR